MAEFLVSTEETDGAFSLIEATEAGGGTIPHYHKETTEVFFVLEGSMTATVDGEERTPGPHDSLYGPPYTVHSFTLEDARILVLMAPGEFELMWHEIAERVEARKFTADTPIEDIIDAVKGDYDHYDAPIEEAVE